MKKILKEPSDPYISVFVPFSRLEFLDIWLQGFREIRLPRRFTELVFLVDSNDSTIVSRLMSAFDDSWNGFSIFQTSNYPGDSRNIPARRDRITTIRNESKGLIGNSSLVFSMEDDTTCPPDAFERLFWTLYSRGAGFSCGVQVGRWGLPHIGAWVADDVYAPRKVTSIPYRPYGLDEVDAGGWYCCLTPTSLYKEADYSWKGTPAGPDLNYGLWLRGRGQKCYADWSVPCRHYISQEKYLFPNEKCISIDIEKSDGYWEVGKPSPFTQVTFEA